jgi:4-hydroxybenzoyl-CoA thioesterase
MADQPNIIVQNIPVTWADCDALGIVFYPHYYRWFDTCSHALFMRQGMGHRVVHEKFGILGCGLIDTGASFRAPARFDDELEATSTITQWSNRTFRIEHVLRRGEVKICAGHELRGWFIADETKPGGIRAGAIPDAFRAAFS